MSKVASVAKDVVNHLPISLVANAAGKLANPGDKPTPLPAPIAPSPIAGSDSPEDKAAAEEVQKKLEEAAALERKQRGRASTILTGPKGLTSEPELASKTLLGY